MVSEVTPYCALRIDVETAPGLVMGLPGLLATLNARDVRATVMVPTGPDRSGLAVCRVIRSPRHIRQMLRLRPGGAAGVVTFLAGFAVPVRSMAAHLRATRRLLAGHETALHGHDHWQWIHRCRAWPDSRVQLEMRRGVAAFARALGHRPTAFGAPGWVVTESSLRAVDTQGFRYASDCRGESPFVPEGMKTPQLPTTLPTVEEILRQGKPADDLYGRVNRIQEHPYSCYCAHAEIEGMRVPDFLPRFLDLIQGRVVVGPLGEAPILTDSVPVDGIRSIMMAGRFDPVASQASSCGSC